MKSSKYYHKPIQQKPFTYGSKQKAVYTKPLTYGGKQKSVYRKTLTYRNKPASVYDKTLGYWAKQKQDYTSTLIEKLSQFEIDTLRPLNSKKTNTKKHFIYNRIKIINKIINIKSLQL